MMSEDKKLKPCPFSENKIPLAELNRRLEELDDKNRPQTIQEHNALFLYPTQAQKEKSLQIPQATRDRYEEYKQLRELSNFYGEKQKTKMFMQEIRKVLADFGLDIEDNKQT